MDELDRIVAGPHQARVSRPQGWISPPLVVDGRIVGVWTAERRGDTLVVGVEPFTTLTRSVRAALPAAAERVALASGAAGAEMSS
jgi:Winged helix DNA-binding domain